MVLTMAAMAMNTKTTLLLAITLIFAGGADAASCKFEFSEAGHVESDRLVLFRGATIGLMGHFGVQDGEHYLRGYFGSNFKGRVLFTEETPLKLTLADNRTLALNVVTEVLSSKMKFGHIITVTRDAEPVYSITPEQWSALRESPIVTVHMPFEAKGERQTEIRDVKSKHAQRIMEALKCVAQEVDAAAGEQPAS